MRTVTLGGNEYQIRGGIQVEAAAAKRRNAILEAAEAQAITEAESAGIEDPSELILKKKKAALASPDYNAGEALQLIADMINNAVEYNRIILDFDSSGKVFGGYPMTAQKLAFIASVEDLNSTAMAEAVAGEMLEAHGGDASKKWTAQDVLKMSALAHASLTS